MYDPLFSQLEIAVLNTLGVIVLSENEVSGSGKWGGEGCVTAHHLIPGSVSFETAVIPSRCLLASPKTLPCNSGHLF